MTRQAHHIIKHQFDRAAATYDRHCDVQNAICDISLELLSKHSVSFERMADFACGTGESTRKLIQKFQFGSCLALDCSRKSLNIARHKLYHDSVLFICCDFDCPILKESAMDLVFCNLGLQWSLNFNETISRLRDCLTMQGMLCFSMPTYDNFPELCDHYRPAYYAHEEVLRSFESSDWTLLETKQVNISKQFESYKQALKSLKYTGTNYNLRPKKIKSGLHKFNPAHFFHLNAGPTLTYKIGIYVLERCI